MEAEEEEDVPVHLVTHVNNILNSIFSNVEVYITNQQIYSSNALYLCAQVLPFQQLQRSYLWTQGVLHSEGYDYEEFTDENMEAPFLNPFSQGEWNCLVDPMALFCMVNWCLTSPPQNCYFQIWKLGYV